MKTLWGICVLSELVLLLLFIKRGERQSGRFVTVVSYGVPAIIILLAVAAPLTIVPDAHLMASLWQHPDHFVQGLASAHPSLLLLFIVTIGSGGSSRRRFEALRDAGYGALMAFAIFYTLTASTGVPMNLPLRGLFSNTAEWMEIRPWATYVISLETAFLTGFGVAKGRQRGREPGGRQAVEWHYALAFSLMWTLVIFSRDRDVELTIWPIENALAIAVSIILICMFKGLFAHRWQWRVPMAVILLLPVMVLLKTGS